MTIFILLIIFQIKHFLADYPLQGKYMLGKFKPGYDYILPLSAHCLVHAGFTFVITSYYTNLNLGWIMAVLDFGLHFLMDRIKASSELLGRYKALTKDRYIELQALPEDNPIRINELKSNTYFWYSLGLDQMVHHLTHYIIIYFIMENL